MSKTKYYADLWTIDDISRKKKYTSLLIKSLENDMEKWSQFPKNTKTIYYSPDYNGAQLVIEIQPYVSIAYARFKTPPVKDHNSELISEKFSNELKILIEKLQETVFTDDVYEMEKLIGNKHSRKEKLDFIELNQIKEQIEETYNDWFINDNEISAKLIAKLIYSYCRDEEIYNLWIEKFNDINSIMNELKKLKG